MKENEIHLILAGIIAMVLFFLIVFTSLAIENYQDYKLAMECVQYESTNTVCSKLAYGNN